VEASWILISKDQAIREKYDRIKIRSDGKRAIVAIARTLLLGMRRMLLDELPYALPPATSGQDSVIISVYFFGEKVLSFSILSVDIIIMYI
jgi:ABC-type iron transport system FetAB ATPase subunit